MKTSPIVAEKGRNMISLELMNRMKLHGMAAAFSESLSSTFADTVTPDGFLNWLLSREWDYHSASFQYRAYLEEFDYTINRGLDRNQMERLASLDFVTRRRTCSSLVRRERERTFLQTRHASQEYVPTMSTHPKC